MECGVSDEGYASVGRLLLVEVVGAGHRSVCLSAHDKDLLLEYLRQPLIDCTAFLVTAVFFGTLNYLTATIVAVKTQLMRSYIHIWEANIVLEAEHKSLWLATSLRVVRLVGVEDLRAEEHCRDRVAAG